MILQEEMTMQQESSGRMLQQALRNLDAQIGLGVAVLSIAIIVIGPFVAPFPPDATGVGLPASGPTTDHWLGTDHLGRDVLSRVLTGGGPVLLPPIAAVSIAYLVGGGLGMLGAYKGGTTDKVIARGFDLLLALPSLLTVLVIIAGLGDSTPILILSVALVYIPRVGRVIRGATQGVVSNEYVAAARLRGERTHSIVLREILPNIAGPAVADAALRLTFAIMFISTLNFLGIGAAPPSSSWGLMVAESRRIIRANPWATVGPAASIALLTIGTNLLADALARQATRQSNERAVL